MNLGSPYVREVTVTDSYTVLDGDDVILVGTLTAAATITLPASAGRYNDKEDKGRIRVVKTGADSFPVIIAAAGGSILGVSELRQQNQQAEFISDGGAYWFGLGGQRSVFVAEVALTNAEIKALRATPKTLVQAPGAGKAIKFMGAVLFHDYGGTNVFTETADNLAVRYTDGSGTLVSQAIETTGFIDQSADTMTTAEPKIDVISAKTACENKALVLHNTGDGEIAGNAGADNTMRVKVFYSVVDTGW